MRRFTVESLNEVAQYRPAGYVEEVLAIATEAGDGCLELTDEAYDALALKYRSPGKVGAELKQLLARIGITAAPGCQCNARANTMDARGIQWCQANIETIVDWLQEEATKRGLPFVRLAGKALVHLAIRRAITSSRKGG